MALVEGVSESLLRDNTEGRELNLDAVKVPRANANGLTETDQRIPTAKAGILAQERTSYRSDGRSENGNVEDGVFVIGSKIQNGVGLEQATLPENCLSLGKSIHGSKSPSPVPSRQNGELLHCPRGGHVEGGPDDLIANGVNGVDPAVDEVVHDGEEHSPGSGSSEYEHLIEAAIDCLDWKVLVHTYTHTYNVPLSVFTWSLK